MLRTVPAQQFFTRRLFARLSATTLVLVLLGAAVGCGKPFNVKTQPNLPPPNYAASATSNNMSIQAQVLTDENALYDNFDANLILAGILPVRVNLTNAGTQNVDLKKARFEIRADGRSYKQVDGRKAFKRLISYYELSTFNKSGYNDSLQDFSAFALDFKAPLEAGQSRHGLLFFAMPESSARGTGLTLVVTKLDGTSDNRDRLELKLN